MSAYKRTPLEFKKSFFCKKGSIPVEVVMAEQKKIEEKSKKAQSLIASVLMANNKLNPAQKQSLREAKELLA